MASTRKTQPKTVDFLDLAVWKTKLPDCQFAVLPASNTRPNPHATQDRLYASVFAPGAICALERGDGKLIWRRELQKYCGASVYLYERKLFAKTSNTLFALNPDSGETFWSFCPYGTDGESIYSSPSAQQNQVFIGDRRGYLHCLDIESGKTIWRRRTNRTRNDDVNSTPVLMYDLVIVSTNAKTVLAYDALSGKLVWKQKLDGPSTFGPIVHQNSVLVLSDSLYVLNPRTGSVRRRLFWSDLKVQRAASTPQSIIVMLRPEIPHTAISAANKEAITLAASELGSKTAMCVIANSGTKRKRQIAAFCPEFRYEASTRLVYLSHLGGVDILRPTTGALVCQLTTSGDTKGGTGLVDVTDGTIYVLTGDGTVHALRHPAQSPTVSG
jgi:outer membrane protein assembly factor BamB